MTSAYEFNQLYKNSTKDLPADCSTCEKTDLAYSDNVVTEEGLVLCKDCAVKDGLGSIIDSENGNERCILSDTDKLFNLDTERPDNPPRPGQIDKLVTILQSDPNFTKCNASDSDLECQHWIYCEGNWAVPFTMAELCNLTSEFDPEDITNQFEIMAFAHEKRQHELIYAEDGIKSRYEIIKQVYLEYKGLNEKFAKALKEEQEVSMELGRKFLRQKKKNEAQDKLYESFREFTMPDELYDVKESSEEETRMKRDRNRHNMRIVTGDFGEISFDVREVYAETMKAIDAGNPGQLMDKIAMMMYDRILEKMNSAKKDKDGNED